MRKEWAFFKLLTTKGYRKVVLIPLAFCLGFFLYYLYIDFTGGEVDKTVYDDGTVRISAQSDLGSCKLPKILDALNIPIHNELKIRNYNVYLDKDENINSVEIYCLTDKEGDEIIEWYKEKLNPTNSTNDAKGIWNNFEMDVSYNKFSNLVSIVLKKQ
ncbi:Lipoprotein [Fusobacterium sp. oral taxon C10]